MSLALEAGRTSGKDSPPGYSTTCSMLQLLSSIETWKVHTCKHSSPLIVPAFAAICISSCSQTLESLEILIQQFQDPGSLRRGMTSSKQLTRLRTHLSQYTECSRTAQLENLLNEISAPAAALSKAHRAMSNVIDDICKSHVMTLEECENLPGEIGRKISHISDRTRLATRKHRSSGHSHTSYLSISITCTDKKEPMDICDLSELLKTRDY